jgi:hypothetical protein
MKNIKLLFFSMLMALTVLTSCQNNDDIIDDMANVTESASLRSALTNLELIINEDGSLNDMENPTGNIIFDFCFDFVYPINLEYNNGTTVTVNNFEELILVLINSTEDLYIVGIEFPFEVEVFNEDSNEIEIISINNEEEFIALIESCGFDNPCDCPDVVDPVCVEIIDDNDIIIITFANACFAECEGFTEEDFIDCGNDSCEDECPDVYEPVCVQTPNGGIVEYDNICLAFCDGYDQEDIVNCENDSCEDECPQEEDPVCVEANGTIITFLNACYAECEGYTEEDFIDCENDSCEDECPDVYEPVCVLTDNGELEEYDNICLAFCDGYDQEDLVDCENDECEIEDIEVIIGECNDDGTYALTIDFDVENCEGQQLFQLYTRNDTFIGDFSLFNLPITIDNFELSGFDNDYLKVCINEISESCVEAEWLAPDCLNNSCEDNCPQNEDPVCVEITENGQTIILTFLNACYAECAGYTDFIDCGGTSCEDECPDVYDPVCVQTPNGGIEEYDNICLAFCDGYDQGDLVDCDPNPNCYEYGFPIQMELDGTYANISNNQEVDEYLDLGYDLVYPIELIINNEIILVFQGILEGVYGPRCD